MSSSERGLTAMVRTFSDIPDTSEEGLPWNEEDGPEATNTTSNAESESMDNNEIEIHSGIPVPSNAGNRGGRSRYPLMKMSVGDCFFIDSDRTDEGRREERTLRQTVSRYHRRTKEDGTRWVVSRQDDNRIGVWRIS